MDPVSTITSCIRIAKEIYDLKQKIDADDADCNQFFGRVNSLQSPLTELKRMTEEDLGTKKVPLKQMSDSLENIENILNRRLKGKKTVFGMIKIFNVVAAQRPTNPLEALSGGISEALFATAGGLLVAIVAGFAHHFLTYSIDSINDKSLLYLDKKVD